MFFKVKEQWQLLNAIATKNELKPPFYHFNFDKLIVTCSSVDILIKTYICRQGYRAIAIDINRLNGVDAVLVIIQRR